MADKKIIRIDTLRRRVAGEIDIDGTMHEVLQLDFGTHHDLAAAEASGDAINALHDAVRRVVPSLSEETARRLDTDDAQIILTLAGAGIAIVEKLFPNAIRPETTQTSPA